MIVPPPAHLSPERGDLRRTVGRAYPIPLVLRGRESVWSHGPGAVIGLLGSLDVENSARYGPTESATYCNIYATDMARQLGCYLPRVWWTDLAVRSIAEGGDPPVEYGTTVREMNANSLHDWLVEWGPHYGWDVARLAEIPDGPLERVQNLVTRTGGCGVIAARRGVRRRSGHITVVIPDVWDDLSPKTGEDGTILAPVQSQAGRTNRKRFAHDWWRNPKFDSSVVAFCYPKEQH